MDIETRIDIRAADTRIWMVMTDVERWPQWTPTVTSIDRLDGGPFAVGSRVRIRQPRLPSAIWVVTVLDERAYFEWESVSHGVRAVAGHRLERHSDAVTTITLSLTWSGWLAPVVRRLFGRLARQYVRTEAESLKKRCERMA